MEAMRTAYTILGKYRTIQYVLANAIATVGMQNEYR